MTQMVPEGGIELRRITIVEYLDVDGNYLFAEEWDDHGNGFTAAQKLGMLEQAKSTVLVPIIRTAPEGFGEDD